MNVKQLYLYHAFDTAKITPWEISIPSIGHLKIQENYPRC